MKELKQVAVLLLVNRYGEFLLGRRQAGKFAAGFYELPGGKQEAGESLLETCIRETKEEIGYNLKQAELIYQTKVPYSIGAVPLNVFYAKLDPEVLSAEVKAISPDFERPKLPALEAAELVWVSGKDALKLPLLPIMRQMLDLSCFRELIPNIGTVDLSLDRNVKI